MTKLQHYQKYQTWYETALVIGFFTLNAAVLSTTIIMEDTRGGKLLPYPSWEPFVKEYSSAICLSILIPALAWLLNKFPFSWQKFKQTLMVYLIASVVFSAIHISGMVGLRSFIYWTQSTTYEMGNIFFEIVFEYRKDLLTFIMLLAGISGYQLLISRLKGEASLISNDESERSPSNCDRLLVRKLGKEFIIKVADIEWLESSGNYVNLHIRGRIYPTRATLGGLIEQISDKGFVRIHRSHGISLDAIDSITPLSSGDSEIRLLNGKVLNLSRRYKDALKSLRP